MSPYAGPDHDAVHCESPPSSSSPTNLVIDNEPNQPNHVNDAASVDPLRRQVGEEQLVRLNLQGGGGKGLSGRSSMKSRKRGSTAVGRGEGE